MSKSNLKRLIVVLGPTAVGKTTISIQLAKHFNTEVISADSRQFYREISIGTAKPTAAEQQGIRHHFIDSLSIFEDYSAGRFEEDCLALLDKLFNEKDTLILTGGSGLYIKALLEGFDAFPEVPKVVREELQQGYKNKGITFLQEELKQRDPDYFKVVDQDNPRRLIRALEVCVATNQPFSSFQQSKKTATQPRNFQPVKVGLNIDRQALYEKINKRVDDMMKQGLQEEVKSVYAYKHLNSLQTVGYQELFDYFDGKISLEKAVELIKRNTRRYAKRQLTWFRKDPEIKWFSPGDYEAIIQHISA